MTWSDLNKKIDDRLLKEQGFFGVAFSDLNGSNIFVNSNTSFHAASTMKTPVMIEIYRQAAAGMLSLDDSVTIKNEFKSIVDSSGYSLSPDDDSETELYRRVGEKITIHDLLYQMITVSSNLATNMLIEMVNATNVTQTMRKLGAMNIQVLRGVEDNKAYEKGLSNTTTPHDLMIIYEKLAKGEVADSASTQAMTDILLHQEFNEIIPAKLPKDVKVAHKTGSITGVRHDSGIIFLPDGRKYVLVLLSKDLKDPDAGIKAMADVSEMIYRFMMNKRQ